ncbi:hypothetical protein I5907_13145 [Panacibacter sp. DH6]|uniref:Uncharacterized protein n=1 Tax=Panacibacter microcysteis TaxID=2793269 RepID=A0A931E8P2_9BACT|nr:hypothetical protein [Panacibacter microcysteis]MBG9377183.1 hypothetical protein [Panacibacter microcysteis]
MKKFIASWYIELFCALLTIACVTGVWMNALQQQVKQKGVTCFSIMQLELPRNEDSLRTILSNVAQQNATALVKQHLYIDFAFMPAVYIGTAFWLLIVGRNSRKINVFFIMLAALQIVPWVFDIIENTTLIKAINDPIHQLSINLQTFKTMVYIKFVIALGGALTAIFTCLRKLFIHRQNVYHVIAFM